MYARASFLLFQAVFLQIHISNSYQDLVKNGILIDDKHQRDVIPHLDALSSTLLAYQDDFR